MKFETICVVGLGYIGLPTATVIASQGLKVVGLEANPTTIATINRGEVHIIEPDLDKAVKMVVEKGLLKATDTAEPADAFMIAVPTPFHGDHQPDLSYIAAACKSIAPVLQRGNLIILESTSPVGATEQMAQWLSEHRPDLSFPQHNGEDSDIRIAHCPERVLPGKVLHELVYNDRIIGGMTPRCSDAAVALYAIFVEGDCIVTNARTAEMCKLSENSFRDVNIAFANELSVICDRLHINVWELIALANHHPRVQILQPGPGVGGHCIAVDPWFIVSSAPEEARLIRTAREVNDAKPEWVLAAVDAAIMSANIVRTDNAKPITVACLGLAFKPDIDDLRESPALEICHRLTQIPNCHVIAVEPNIAALPPMLADVATFEDAGTAIQRADVVVVLVDHSPFKDITLGMLRDKQLVDTRGLFSRHVTARVVSRS
jgi:UDP-N-acetyl-D-mannosaminuronic acid dehydrogenase